MLLTVCLVLRQVEVDRKHNKLSAHSGAHSAPKKIVLRISPYDRKRERAKNKHEARRGGWGGAHYSHDYSTRIATPPAPPGGAPQSAIPQYDILRYSIEYSIFHTTRAHATRPAQIK